MDEIASLQGISKKTLYKFFPNKDALLSAALEERFKEIAAEVAGIGSDPHVTFIKRLKGVFSVISRQIAELSENLIKDIYYNKPEIWERMDTFRRERIFGIVTRLLEEGTKEGFIRADIDGQLVPLLFVSAVSSVVTPAQLVKVPVPPGRALRRLHPHSLRRGPDGDGAPPVLHPGGEKMKPVLIAACACLALAGCAKATDAIEASGTIEATSVQVSSKSSGEVLHLDADEGSRVKKGDILAVIDHANLDIQLGQAKSGSDLAQAQLDLLTNGARGEDLAQAQEALNEANENLSNAQEDFQRMDSLFKVGCRNQEAA